MITYLLMLVWFFILIKWAGFLVDGASSIAKKLWIPAIVIWMTLVAFGTSTQESIVSIIASVNGHTDIAIGNILWSNISNILLILWITSIIFPLTAKKNTVIKEIPFSLLASLLIWILANDILLDHSLSNKISRIDGLVLMCFFIIFIYYTFEASKEKTSDDSNSQIREFSYVTSIFYILIGLICLVLWGKRVVDGAVEIALKLGISESVVWLTIVAIGTSLPELATSVVAAYKKQVDIAVWNVVWSNIFNVFWILWISAFISPLPFSASSNIDVAVSVLTNVLLLLALYIGKRFTVEKRQWALMVVCYIVYLTYLITSR